MRIPNFINFKKEKEKVPFHLSQSMRSVLSSIEDDISIEILRMDYNLDMVEVSEIDTKLDDSDMVSFIPGRVLVTKHYGTNDPYYMKNSMKYYPLHSGSSAWMKGRNSVRLGRLVRTLFGDKFTDIQIESFINKFKSKNTEKKSKFKLYSGKEIEDGYNTNNYSLGSAASTLGKSCMNDSPNYLQIYVDNPEVVSLLVLVEDQIDLVTEKIVDKIVGRSLIWKITDGRTLMDRVYYSNDKYAYKFADWANKNKTLRKYANSLGSPVIDKKLASSISVNLKKDINEYDRFPYMDTLNYAYDNIITNRRPDDDAVFYILSDVSGGRLSMNQPLFINGNGLVRSNTQDDDIPENEAEYINYNSDQWCFSDWVETDYLNSNPNKFTYSEMDESWYRVQDCVWSEFHNCYVFRGKSTYTVVKDSTGKKHIDYIHDGYYDEYKDSISKKNI